jgi:hypothetical protein
MQHGKNKSKLIIQYWYIIRVFLKSFSSVGFRCKIRVHGASNKGVKCLLSPFLHNFSVQNRFSFLLALRHKESYGLLILEISRSQKRPTKGGRTPLDEWSVCRRELYLTTHDTYRRQTSMPPVGFEPVTSGSEWQQTHALDRVATGIVFPNRWHASNSNLPLFNLKENLYFCILRSTKCFSMNRNF